MLMSSHLSQESDSFHRISLHANDALTNRNHSLDRSLSLSQHVSRIYLSIASTPRNRNRPPSLSTTHAASSRVTGHEASIQIGDLSRRLLPDKYLSSSRRILARRRPMNRNAMCPAATRARLACACSGARTTAS